MDDVSPVGGAQRKHERHSSLSRSFASQPKQHARSPNSAVVGSVKMKNAASMAEKRETLRCSGTRVPQIDSQAESGERSQRCLGAEATAEPTMSFQEPHLLLPVTSISHSVVATDYAPGSDELKGTLLPIASVSGSRSSLSSSLPCVVVPPSSGTSLSPSVAFPERRADSRMPVEGARGAPSPAPDEDCMRQGTFAGKSNGTLHEKQAHNQDSHGATKPIATLPGSSDNESQASRRTGPNGYNGGGEQVSSWSKGHGLPLGKQHCRNGERACEDLPEIYKCGGGPEGMDREALVCNAEDAILAGTKAMKDHQTSCAVQVRAEGSTRGSYWDKVEARLESNSVRRNNVAVRPLTGTQRSKTVYRGHRGRSILANTAVTSRPLLCGVATPQNSSALYTPPVSTVSRPASGGVGAASAGICEKRNRPFFEIWKDSKDYDEYLQNIARCGPAGGRLMDVNAEGGRANNGEAAKFPPDSATSQGERREINLSESESTSAHVTESENASAFRCRFDEAAVTTEVSRLSSKNSGEYPQGRLVQQENGTLVPTDGTRTAFPPSAESVEVLKVHPHDANKGTKNPNGQGLQDVVSLRQHFSTGEGRSCSPAHEQRKHSVEGLSRSERSTAAGSYCEISSESALYSGPSIAGSDSSVESTATLKDFCGTNGERIMRASIVASECTLGEKQVTAQESHTQGSGGTPCLPLRDAWERNANESTEKTLSSHRCDEENSVSLSSTGQTMGMSMGHTGVTQPVSGHAGGELIRPGTLAQQQRQQQLQRRQLQQGLQRQHSGEHNLLEQYYLQQHLEQQQLEQQNLRHQQQLGQQELRKHHLEQQHLRQQREQQHLRQHQLRQQHLRQHIREQQRQQKGQQKQQAHGQQKLPLNHEYQHQQQDLERHQQLAFSVSGWMGQHHGLYATAAHPPGVPAQLAADSYKSMRQATALALKQDKRGGSTTGEEACVAVAGGEQAAIRKIDELLVSGSSASQEPIDAAEAMGRESVSQPEYDEISARFSKRNEAEVYGGAVGRKPAEGTFNSVASERKSSRCNIQDAAADAGNRQSRSAQQEEKKEAQDRAGVAAVDSPIHRKPATTGSSGEDLMQRNWSGNSSSDTEREEESHILSSQDALVEQCCDDIWYHHAAKCYVVFASPTGEKKLFLFSEKKYGKEVAQGLAVACQKNRLTPEQLPPGIPLRRLKDAAAAAVVSDITEGLKTCPLFPTEEEEPALEGPAAGGRAVGAIEPEGPVASWWTHEAPRGDFEADTFLSRYSQHAMLLQRQQQQRQHQELRQQQASPHHQELRQQQQELRHQEGEQRRYKQQKLLQKQQELRQQQEEELHQSQKEMLQHAAKEDAAVQPQEADVLPFSQKHQAKLRQEEQLMQQQQSLYEQQDEFLQQRQQQYDAVMQQRQQRETQISAAQHQVDWDAAALLEEKNERAAHPTKRATAAATAAVASVFEHPSFSSDEQQELLRTEEQQQQQQETSSAANAGDVSASFRRSKPKDEDSTAATSIATRMPRKRTQSRRAADTDKGGTAARKRSRNTTRSCAHVQDEGIAAAEAYKAGSRETPHGVWFNSHTKSWTCATVGPRRQLLVFSSARYGFEAARALAIEARIRSVQALQEQQQQQLQQQEQQQKQYHAEQQQMQQVNPHQHYLQSQQLYGQEQGQPVGVANTQERQQHGGEQDRQQQQQTRGWSDNTDNNKSNRNAHRNDDLWSNGSNNAVQTRGRSYEQCTAGEGGAVTAKKGKEVTVAPEVWTLQNTSGDTIESSFGESTEGRSISHRCVPEGVCNNSSKWSSCGVSRSNSSASGMTEKEEQLLYVGKAAISLVLSDLLEVCLPQLQVLPAHTRNDLRACIDSALCRVRAAAHPAQLQPFFNLFGSCFLRAKAPSSLPLDLRIHYFEALSGLRLPLHTEEQQSAAVHAGGADTVDEAKHAVAED